MNDNEILNEEKNKENKEIKIRKKEVSTSLFINTIIKIIIPILIVIVIISLFFGNKERKRIIKVKSDLVSAAKISKLNSARFVYNGIAEKKVDGKTVYYVRYGGTVTAGIDLEKIDYEEDKLNKKIIVTVPKVKIRKVTPDLSDLDFIYEDTKYKTETVHQEGAALAKEDLLQEAKKDKNFLNKAQEKCKSVIKGLIEPLIKASGNNYELVIKGSDSDE